MSAAARAAPRPPARPRAPGRLDDGRRSARRSARRAALARQRIGELAARFAPRATLPGLLALTDLLTVTFVVDDLYDAPGSAPGLADRNAVLRAAVHTPTPSTDPVGRAVQRVLSSHAALASRGLNGHLARAIDESLAANLAEHLARSRLVPDLDAYLRHRRATTWFVPIADVLAVADGTEPAPAELDRPAVRALIDMTNLVTGWDNDVYGYARDHAAATLDRVNLPDVLVRSLGCAPAEAVRLGLGLRDEVLARFLRLGDRTAATAGPALRALLANLTAGIRGHLDWTAGTDRFRTAGTLARWPQPLTDRRPVPPVWLPPISGSLWWWPLTEG
ncbi:terpene synthase family protein [Kitasatospora sp. NPDC054939]